MMFNSRVVPALAGLMIGLMSITTQAALVAKPGYQSETLYSSAGTFTTIGGLDHHQEMLYFGQSTEIKSLDLSDNGDAVVGTIPANVGNALVTVYPADGKVYTAYGTSYDPPSPHKMGYFDGSGSYVHQLDMDGIYDAAVNGDGDVFIVANPDVDDDDVADGSRIYRYDWSTGAATEVANIGGYSSGLAFDASGNLYYSVYGAGQVVKFTAAEVATGGLDLGDADTVLTVSSPGFLAFDDQDNLFASYLDASWATHIALYDPTTGNQLAVVADGGGKMAWADGTLYTIDTDWSAFASTIEAITPVPEPTSLMLLAVAGAIALALPHRRARP